MGKIETRPDKIVAELAFSIRRFSLSKVKSHKRRKVHGMLGRRCSMSLVEGKSPPPTVSPPSS